MEAVWIATIGLFAAPVAAFITWFLNRGRDRSHSTSSLVTASSSAVDAIREVLDTYRSENKMLHESVGELMQLNISLKNEIDDLRQTVEECMKSHS